MALVSTLSLIGYWWSPEEPDWPHPAALIDQDWDEEERRTVATYFRHGTLAASFLGNSCCRICTKDVGCHEFTDGVFVWPQGLAHYIEEHSVRLPQPLIDHALARHAVLETAQANVERWKRWCGVEGPKEELRS